MRPAQRHPLTSIALLFLTGLCLCAPAAGQTDELDLLKSLGKQGDKPSDAAAPLTDREIAIHLLNRLAFGARPGQVEQVMRMGWQEWLSGQLKPYVIDDSETDAMIASRFPSTAMSMTEVFETYRPPFRTRPPSQADAGRRQALQQRAMAELQAAVLMRAVHSERQFQEVILEFWRNHFNIDQTKDSCGYVAADYEHTLRKHAFGKFEELLLATAKHPAMLIYLDNALSRKPLPVSRLSRLPGYRPPDQASTAERLATQRGLNENYARELMELHTLGVDNGYTEADVVALSRILTGWSVGVDDDDRYGFIFYADKHDDGIKRFLGRPFRGGGIDEGEQAIRMLANDKRTAKFIAFKLCRYLVHDEPPAELVERVADSFVKNDGDLTAVYEAIIYSKQFLDRGNFRAKFKTPFEFVASALRAVDAKADQVSPTLYALATMGQTLYQCEDPTGYDDRAAAWLDPGVLVHRWEYALALTGDSLRGVRVSDEFRKACLNANDEKARQKLIDSILPAGMDARTQAILTRDAATPARTAGMLLGSPAFQQQ